MATTTDKRKCNAYDLETKLNNRIVKSFIAVVEKMFAYTHD